MSKYEIEEVKKHAGYRVKKNGFVVTEYLSDDQELNKTLAENKKTMMEISGRMNWFYSSEVLNILFDDPRLESMNKIQMRMGTKMRVEGFDDWFYDCYEVIMKAPINTNMKIEEQVKKLCQIAVDAATKELHRANVMVYDGSEDIGVSYSRNVLTLKLGLGFYCLSKNGTVCEDLKTPSWKK